MIRRRPPLALLLPATAVAVLVLVLDRWTDYTSDSVADQSLVRTWLDVGHGTAYVPGDTWILKLPLYFGVESLPLAPGGRLVVEVLVLNVACLAVLGLAVWWLALAARPAAEPPRAADVVLPLLWLGTLGGELGANRMQPNYRNVELGLAFLALAIAARRLDLPGRQDGRRAGFTAVAAVPLLGLLWVDDPYFALLTGAPFAVLCVTWYLVRRRGDRRLLVAAAAVVLSLALLPPAHALLAAGGIRVLPGAAGTDPGGVPGRLALLGPAIAAQLGLADTDPAGRVPGTGTALSGWAAALNLAVLLAAVAAAVALAVHGWRSRRLLPAFVGVQWLVVIAGFCASSKVSEVAHGRYLILAGYDLATGLAMALPALRRRLPAAARTLLLVLLAGAVLNVTCALRTAPAILAHGWDRRPPYVAGPPAAARGAAIRNAVAASGLRRGYAEFWASNLTLYRSGGLVSMNAVRCLGGRLVVENWLTDTARRTAPARGGTFVVWEAASPALRGCPPAALAARYGPPARAIPAGPGAAVLVWTRDIGPLIPAWNPSAAG